MNTFKKTINGQAYKVNDNLKTFDIFQKPSSNVAFFGIATFHNALFIQFNNGACYVYREVPTELLAEAPKAESIGKWYYANIKGKYEDTSEKVENNCIEIDLDGDGSDDEDDYDLITNDIDW